jgi:predicted lipid carrier protein YhbT
MATVKQCRKAVEGLASALADVDPDLRARHIPTRVVACRVTDLDLTLVARLDEHGLHEMADADDDTQPDVRLSMTSDELVALADGRDDFIHAWLRGRVQVSASMRDLLRLRSMLSG